MKVNKSSKDCAAHNLTIQAEIDLGLSEAWEPSELVLQGEAKELARIEACAKRDADMLSVLKQLDPNTNGDYVFGIRAKIEAVYTGSSKWSSGSHTGWRLVFGSSYTSSENPKVTIGEGRAISINDKQLARAKAKLEELLSLKRIADAKQSSAQSAQARTTAFIAANGAFCEAAGHSSYNSGETLYYGSPKRAHYQTAFIVLADGSVKIGHETYTIAQWREIFGLRAAQAAAMKALKASFATATVNA